MSERATGVPSLEHAFALHRQGRLADAERAYRALAGDPRTRPPALGLLGALLLQTARSAEAVDVLRQAADAEPSNAAVHANLALALLAQHDHAGALASAERALALVPAYPEALNSRGNALQALGRVEDAVASYDAALELRGDYAEALWNRGRALEALSRPGDAAASLERALALAPSHRDGWFRLGRLRQRLGDHGAAVACYDRVLAIAPDAASAHVNRGNALLAQGDVAAALASYERALEHDPGFADALANRGNALRLLGRLDEALAACTAAIGLAPDHAEARVNRSATLIVLGRPEDALADLDRALAVEPGLAAAHANRGSVLAELGRDEDALASFAQALAVDPAAAPALACRGSLLLRLRRYDEALADIERALALDPGHADALDNRAFLHHGAGRFAEAADDYARLLALSPEHAYAAGNLVACRLRIGDWNGIEAGVAALDRAVRAGACAATPFHYLAVSTSPADQLACARTFALAQGLAAPPPSRPAPYGGRDRLRLAYLSGDFHDHATAYLIAGLIERHDRQQFEVTGISYGPDDGGAMRARLRRGFDRFVDVRAMDDGEVAAWMRAQEIDIAVDLKGWTYGGRPAILAQRPAPVQVSYLGYPGTLGIPAIDYVIADAVVIPHGDERWYSEQVVRLPDSYQVNDAGRAIDEHAPPRGELGLPGHGFVFCCFNNTYKILPDVFGIWMRLLDAVPGSVLWLLADNDAAVRNLRREAAARGIAPERLVFAPRVAQGAHLARHRRADLFLDTLPYNAHTTASDALWAGLPVLTCAGGTFAGRVGASVLHAAGQGALVTHTLDDYEALALKLATTPALLASLRARLVRERDTCALFDTTRFARNLECAYRVMHARALGGLAPEGFDLPPAAGTGGAAR